MPIFLLALVCIGFFIWSNWGRAKARSELSRKLDPMWDRLRKPKQCRWVASRQHGQGLREFTCETCHVTAYSGHPDGPKDCKKTIGGGAL
ncbi:hypothetical protein EGN72_12400 [Pseudorhodobacter sp. E13]|uniref:hypothetical protein n=1 Tax=Pseudorhodobacter sp. E13 TaxID=2487931 RepID=UPI000F8E4F84|nr:hypothetical protein [Pseudorhodobacter sp. E13]RUS59515.1 hypothetical protein EGN72_12400 [Pseudorhodobacter sp. E13]